MKAQIKSTTSQIIHQIWGNNSPDKAVLSALRNSDSILSKNATTVWPLILKNLPENDLSINGKPTYGELAVFTALRAYAIYQQGTDQFVFASTADEGSTFFRSLSHLRQNEQIVKGLDRRVQAVLASNNFNSLVNDLYHLLSIFKAASHNEQIDFAQLGQDLYFFQMNNELARQICLKWGQEYYRVDSAQTTEK